MCMKRLRAALVRPELNWLGLLLLVLMVPMVSAGLLSARVGATFEQLRPFWSDELYYIKQAQAFHEVGLEAGYFTVDERPARLSYSHYYVWSPFVPAWYSPWVSLHENPIWLANTVWLALATLGAGLMLQVSLGKSLLGIVVLATFPALHLLYPTSMQDGMHMGIAVLMSAAVARALQRPVTTTERVLVMGGLLIAVLARPTWGLLTLPYLLLSAPRLSWRLVVGYGLVCAVLVAPLALLFQWSSAPYPHFRSGLFDKNNDLIIALKVLGKYVLGNIALMDEGSSSALLQRVQLVGGVLALGAGTLSGRIDRRAALFHGFNLVSVLLAVLALHDVIDNRDFRVIAPHLLLSLLVLAWGGSGRWIAAYVASVLVCIGALLTQYTVDVMPNVQPPDSTYTVELAIAFQPDPNAWCNTVSMSLFYIRDFTGNADMLLAFDAGLGLTWLSEQHVPSRFQAAYLLLTDDDALAWANRLNIQRLTTVNQGSLYRNLDADCSA